MIKSLIFHFMEYMHRIHREVHGRRYQKKFRLPEVTLGLGFMDGSVAIGKGTYINDGYRIVTGPASKIAIGRYCAIGRNFTCAARSHSLVRPTASKDHPHHLRREADIIIGNGVWIGENVFIREGVVIGDHAIVGANSVVTKNVENFEIVGGVPARRIRFNSAHYLYHNTL